MRIAINTRFLIKGPLEGIGRYSYEITRRLAKENSDVEFHLFFDRPYDSKYIFGPNVRGHVLFPPARHPLLWWWWYEVSVVRKLRALKIDAFISPDGFISLRSKIPSMLVTHDLAYLYFPRAIRQSHLWYFKNFVPVFHKRAEKIVAVSEFTKKSIVQHYKIEPQKIVVGSNGRPEAITELSVEEKYSVKEKFTSGCEYFICVGAIHPRKNLIRTISSFEIFRTVNKSNTKLVIVGRWAWKHGNIRKAIQDSAFKEDIIHLDQIDNIYPLMASSLGLCYVSLFEGFGIPILEAFECGIPVITSNVSSMPEVAGDAALLVDPQDERQIAHAMNQLYMDKKLVQNLVRKGHMQKRKFSWDNTSYLIMKEIRSMLK
jgi:glycosyltransferase involved in cell wall biosynthesis